MFDRVIVPLDGSKLAEVALPYAEELATKLDCHIILLTVAESNEVGEIDDYHVYANKMVELTKRHAEKYIDEKRGRPIFVGAVSRKGNPAEEILNYAKNGSFSLIVMASHGRSGVKRWAVGSVADKVVRGTRWEPVLLVRAKDNRSDIREKRILRRALVPLDGSAKSRSIIPYIKEIARMLRMELILLQVMPTNHQHDIAKDYLQKECTELNGAGITARFEVSVGYAADRIIDLANELACDLVAMSTGGKSSLLPWSLGSVAQKVFLGGDTPLLLAKVFNENDTPLSL